MKTKIIIIMDGGIIQNILSDSEDVETFVVDYDVEGADNLDITQVPYIFIGSDDKEHSGVDDAVVFELYPQIYKKEVDRLYEIIQTHLLLEEEEEDDEA